MLQHFYFFAVAAIVLALIVLRIIILRRRHQALSTFFRVGYDSQFSYGSYPPHGSGDAFIHGIQLASPPAVYRTDRRIRGADIDAYGRRLGPAGEQYDGKEALPAYDCFDRPPKYVEAGAASEQFAVTPGGEQSGTAHPTTAAISRAPDRHTLDNTHAAEESDMALPPPPIDDHSPGS